MAALNWGGRAVTYENPSVTRPDIPPPPVTPELQGRRPFGLKAIITLMILQVIALISIYSLYLYVNSEGAAEWTEDVTMFATWYDLLTWPILAGLRLVAIIGLWQMRRWAWFLTMGLLAYAMAYDIISFFQGSRVYVPMLLNVLTVFYLNLQEVQRLFIRPGESKS
jgi:hypothetical protein